MKRLKSSLVLFIAIILFISNSSNIFLLAKTVAEPIKELHFTCDVYLDDINETRVFVLGDSNPIYDNNKFVLLETQYESVRVTGFGIAYEKNNNNTKELSGSFKDQVPHKYQLEIKCYDKQYYLNSATKVFINDIEYTYNKNIKSEINKDGSSFMLIESKNKKTPYKLIDKPTAINHTYDGTEKLGLTVKEGYILRNNTGIDAGEYTATVSLLDHYMWRDRTRDDKEINWSISKAKVKDVPEIPTGFTGYIDDSLSTVTLGKDWKWSNPNETMNALGANKYKAIFAPNGEFKNYEPYEKEIAVEVKNKIKIAAPIAKSNLVYTGKDIIGVEDGAGYTISDNLAKDAGDYEAIASLEQGYIWKDGTAEDKIIPWSIAKAAGSEEVGYEIPSNLEATQGEKLSDIKLPEHWSWIDASVDLNEIGEQNFEAKYTPKDTQNYEEIITKVTVKVNKKPDVKIAVPQPVKGLIYNKTEQIGVNEGKGYTLSANTATNAGEYTAIAKLKQGYAWEDGSHDNKEIHWSIAKALGSDEEGYEIPSNLKATQGDKLSKVELPEHWSWIDASIDLNEIGEQSFDAIYTPKDKNNYEEVNVNLSVNVNKKPDIKIVVPQAIECLVYNKTEQIGVIEGTGYTLTNSKSTNAGEYTAIAKLKDGYVWEDGSYEDREIPWSIEKASGSEEEGYKVPDKLEATQGEKLSDIRLPENWSWVDASVDLNEIGEKSFDAKYTPIDTQNYEESIAKVSVKVNKKPDVKIKVPKAVEDLVYNKEEQIGVIEGTGYILTSNKSTNTGSYTAVATLSEGYVWEDGTHDNKEILWSIAKAFGSDEEGYKAPDSLKATEGQKLLDIKLPEHWSWINPETILDTVGEQSFDAKYTPIDTQNYEEVSTKVRVKVNKKPDISIVTPKAVEGLIYNKEEQKGVNESEGYTLSDNTAINAGEYTAVATLLEGYVWEDNTHEDKEIYWSIAKAPGSEEEGYVLPIDLEAIEGQKLSDIELPERWSWINPKTILDTVGEQSFEAKYTPKDNKNYDELTINLSVNVNKKPDVKIEVPKAVEDLVYNKGEQAGVTEGTGYTLTNNESTNAGEYTAVATLLEGYAWEDGTHDNREIPWSIEKAPGSSEDGYEIPSNLEATQGDKLSKVVLPEHWSWINPETSLDTAGEQSFDAIYTPVDTQNYEESVAKVSVKVNKASTPKVEEDDDDYEYEHDDYDYYYYRRQRIRENLERRTKERQLAEEKAREEKRAAEAKKEKELVSRRLILSIGSKSVNKFGTIINNDVAPIIRNQRTMLPARLVAESLGATVTWNPVSRTVIIIGNNIKTGKLVNIVLTIDSKFAMINGVQTELDSPTFIENRRTYTPVRLIAELIGADVEWDGINNNVIISK